MSGNDITRRLFLVKSSTGLGAAWLAANMPEIVAAQEHAHRAVNSTNRAPVKFEFFTSEQAADVEAIAAQIIPADDSPGAREAGVIYFIDRALMTFDSDKKQVYQKGLEMVAQRASRINRGRFAGLTPAQQVRLLKSIEKTVFFEQVRTHTIMGFFVNPEHGGNRDQIGWKLIGFEDRFYYEPPFGHYDRGYKEDQ